MNYKAICEFAIHVHSFRNIDIFYPGIFNFKLRLYEKKKGASDKEVF